jgi:hypothetical protein
VLALTAFVIVLQKQSLDFHVVLAGVAIGLLDKAVEVVVRSRGIGAAGPERLLVSHPALIIVDVETVLSFSLVSLVALHGHVSTEAAAWHFIRLVKHLLIVFVLLSVLLEQLPEARVELCADSRAVALALLGCRLRPVELSHLSLLDSALVSGVAQHRSFATSSSCSLLKVALLLHDVALCKVDWGETLILRAFNLLRRVESALTVRV